jgi:hypothetical protein
MSESALPRRKTSGVTPVGYSGSSVDMMPEGGLVEPEEDAISRLRKHASLATDMHATIEEPQEVVFTMWSAEAIRGTNGKFTD